MIVKNVKQWVCLKWTLGHFGHNYMFAALSTFYLTVSGITILSLKSIGQF